jgi:uncharacterized protein YlaI
MKYPRWVKWEDFNQLVNKYGTWEVNRAISFCPIPQNDEEYQKILCEVERIASRLRDDIISYYMYQNRPEIKSSPCVEVQGKVAQKESQFEEIDVCDVCGGILDPGWYDVQAVSWLNNRTLHKYICPSCYHKVEALLNRR